MSIFIYLALLLIGLFFAVASSLYLLFFIDNLGGHDLPTSKRAIKKICEIISEYKGNGNALYDLGCGRGTFIIAIKRRFPHFSCVAIDKSVLRLFFARLKNVFFRQKILFKKMDIFDADLQDADIVYTYLWYDLMPPLEKKLQKELSKGAVVITNTSHFLDWKPTRTYITHPKKPEFEKLFVYIKD